MRHYTKFLLFAVMWGMFIGIRISLWNDSITFVTIVMKFGFSELYFWIASLSSFVEWYFPMVMFQILWGTYIYRHFCSASVYYFSRCDQRRTWFLKESLLLYPYVLTYLVTMLLVSTCVISILEPVHYGREAIPLLAYYLSIHSLWLYFTTLLINVLSIKLERSEGGFLIVGGLQALCVAVFVSYESLLERFGEVSPGTGEIALDGRGAALIIGNPLSHLVLKWHSSGIRSIKELINEYSIAFDLNLSLALFLVISILVVWMGCRLVGNQDIIVTDKETGGV